MKGVAAGTWGRCTANSRVHVSGRWNRCQAMLGLEHEPTDTCICRSHVLSCCAPSPFLVLHPLTRTFLGLFSDSRGREGICILCPSAGCVWHRCMCSLLLNEPKRSHVAICYLNLFPLHPRNPTHFLPQPSHSFIWTLQTLPEAGGSLAKDFGSPEMAEHRLRRL